MRTHLFFKSKEVSLDELLDKFDEKDLPQLLNFFEEMLKEHPSIMPGVHSVSPVLPEVMRQIHDLYLEQVQNNSTLASIAIEEAKMSKGMIRYHYYPSYNNMTKYLDLMKKVVALSKDISLVVEEQGQAKPQSPQLR